MSDDFIGHTPNGMGLANTAVLAALLQHLMDIDLLVRDDVIAILAKARSDLAPNQTIIPVMDAMDIVTKLSRRFEKNS